LVSPRFRKSVISNLSPESPLSKSVTRLVRTVVATSVEAAAVAPTPKWMMSAPEPSVTR
jgi:hypothetical protein